METRLANPEGKGEISMLDLLVNSLRMRPDRIIFGEIRKKKQAEVLFEALHTGHSIYSTVHADTMGETIRRLINPPIDLPPNLLSSINLNVVMFRDRRKGIRRVLQIGEFVDAEGESISVKPNVLYRWKSDTNQIVKFNESIKLFEELSRHTGMTLAEIKKDIKEKQEILEWMVKNNMRSVEEVGAVIRDYYLTPNYKPHKPIIIKEEKKLLFIPTKEEIKPKNEKSKINVKILTKKEKPKKSNFNLKIFSINKKPRKLKVKKPKKTYVKKQRRKTKR